MNTRRDFFKSAAAVGILGAAGLPLRAAETPSPLPPATDDRRYWVSVMDKIARPVLENLARRELKKKMPVEEKPGAKRASVTHLEAFGRLLYGLAAWLALQNLTGDELKLQQEFLKLAQASLDAASTEFDGESSLAHSARPGDSHDSMFADHVFELGELFGAADERRWRRRQHAGRR